MIRYDMQQDNDCLRACIETLLQCPGQVPHFAEAELGWYGELTDWARSIGLEADVQQADRFIPPGFYIAIGRSPREEERGHAVIMTDRRLLHDPHKSRSGIRDAETVVCFYLRDAMRYNHWRQSL